MVAAFLHIDPNTMMGEEVLAHRAQLRLRTITLSVVSLLLLLSLVGGGLAYSNWKRFQHGQAASLLEQARTAVVQGVSQAASIFGAASLNLNNGPLDSRILANEYHSLPKLIFETASTASAITEISFIGESNYIISQSKSDGLHFYELEPEGNLIEKFPLGTNGTASSTNGFAISDNGKFLLLYIPEKEGGRNHVEIYSVVSGKDLQLKREKVVDVPGSLSLYGISEDGTEAFMVMGSRLSWINTQTKQRIDFPVVENADYPFDPTAMEIHWGKRQLALGNPVGELIEWIFPREAENLLEADPLNVLDRGKMFTETNPEASANIDILEYSYGLDGELYVGCGIYGYISSLTEYDLSNLATRANSQLYDLESSRDGTYLVAAGSFLSADLTQRSSEHGYLSFFHNNNKDQVQKRIIYPGDSFTSIGLNRMGSYLVTGTNKGLLNLWRLPNYGEHLAQIPSAGSVLYSSGAGLPGTVVSLDEDKYLRVYVPSENLWVVGLEISDVIKVTTSKQSDRFNYIRRSSAGTIRIATLVNNKPGDDRQGWDLDKTLILQGLEIEQKTTISDEGDVVAIPTGPSNLKICYRNGDLETLKLTPDEEIRVLSIGPKAKWLIVCTDKRILKVRLNTTWKRQQVEDYEVLLEEDNYFNGAVFSNSGRFLAVFDSEEVLLVDLVNGKQQRIEIPSIEKVSFARNDKYLCVVSTPRETALSVYELPGLKKSAERIDLGVAYGTVVSYESVGNEMLLGVTTAQRESRLNIYDIGNILDALVIQDSDNSPSVEEYEKRYGYKLDNGAI